MNFKHITFFFAFVILSLQLSGQGFWDISATQCDSLINANVDNPDFVILDVRTPGEYNPEHLEGAITRDFYDNDFSDQLDVLPKHKTFLIHCRSGGRSGATITMMENLEFTTVYNMLGGIIAWNAASLPVTAEFAPRLMAVSDTIYDLENVLLGTTETINITITNRANSNLTFAGITDLTDTEFDTNFDQNVELNGSDDYTFSIFYTPIDLLEDNLVFTIESNGGVLDFDITRNGTNTVSTFDLLQPNAVRLFPMPASYYLNVVADFNIKDVLITDMNGRSIGRFIVNNGVVNISTLKSGAYLMHVFKQNKVIVEKIVIKH